MQGPLSLKQMREETLLNDRLLRDENKHAAEERRKDQLHNIKLQEAAAKANQSLGHKDETHKVKLQDTRAPLAKKPQAVPKSIGTDTVPAMLTPGEAVIPRSAAQDPKNKQAIRRMVGEGRMGFQAGTVGVPEVDPQGFDESAWRASEEERQRLLAQEAMQARSAEARNAYETERANDMLSSLAPTAAGNVPPVAAQPAVPVDGYTAADRDKFAGKPFFIPLSQHLPSPSASDKTSDKPVPPSVPYEQTVPAEGGGSRKLTVAERHNNQGNLVFVGQPNATRGEHKANDPGMYWAKFATPELGRAALERDITLKMNRGMTLLQVMEQYAPGRDNNNPAAYAKTIGDSIGIGVNERIPADKMQEVADVITKVESGGKFGTPTRPVRALSESEKKDIADLTALANDPNSTPVDRKWAQNRVNLLTGNGGPTVPVGVSTPRNRLQAVTGSKNLGETLPMPPDSMSEAVPPVKEKADPYPPAEPYDYKEGTPPKLDKQLELEANTMNLPTEAEIAARDADISKRAQERQADLNTALTKIKGSYPPEKQEAALADTIKGFFKDLFTGKELARFALVSAGGMLTGASAGGSMRFAAKDTLTAMDRRVAEESVTSRQEAHDTRLASKEERNKLIDLGYDPKKIDEYQAVKKGGFKPDIQRDTKELNRLVESGMSFEDATQKVIANRSDSTSILGDPLTRTKGTGHAPRVVVIEGGKLHGKSVTFNEVKTMQGIKEVGTQWVTTLEGKPYSEQAIQKMAGANAVMRPFDKNSDTEEGRSEAMGKFGESLSKDAKESLDLLKDKVGADNPKLAKLPRPSVIGSSAIRSFEKFGFHSDKASDRSDMNAIFGIAMERMMGENASDPKASIKNFEQYINEAVIMQRSGLEMSSFMNKDGKPMTANHLTSLNTKISNDILTKSEQRMDPRVVQDKVHQRLSKLHSDFVIKSKDDSFRKKYAPGSEVSGFFRYATEEASK